MGTRRAEIRDTTDAAVAARRARRYLAVLLSLAVFIASAFWAVACATWLAVLENPPPGWRRDPDAWQREAVVWGNAAAALIALVAVGVALVGRRPFAWSGALLAAGLVVQAAVLVVMRSGGLP